MQPFEAALVNTCEQVITAQTGARKRSQRLSHSDSVVPSVQEVHTGFALCFISQSPCVCLPRPRQGEDAHQHQWGMVDHGSCSVPTIVATPDGDLFAHT